MDSVTVKELIKKFPVIIEILNLRNRLPAKWMEVMPDIKGLNSISSIKFDPEIYEYCTPNDEIHIIVTPKQVLFHTTDDNTTLGDFILKWFSPIEENHKVFGEISHIVHLKYKPEFKLTLIPLPAKAIQTYLREKKAATLEMLDNLLNLAGSKDEDENNSN